MWRTDLDRGRREAGLREGEAKLVLELPVAGLDDEDPLRVRQERLERGDRERPQRERPEEADLARPRRRSASTAALRHPRRRAERDDERRRVVAGEEVGALLGLHAAGTSRSGARCGLSRSFSSR